MIIQASKFKAQCLRILDEVAATGESVTITKRGRIVARLVAASADSSAKYPQLDLIGTVTASGDIVSPPLAVESLSFDSENV